MYGNVHPKGDGQTRAGVVAVGSYRSEPSNNSAEGHADDSDKRQKNEEPNRKHYLPPTAPVSSLLPQIPTNPAVNVQAQLLALLNTRHFNNPISSVASSIHNPVQNLTAADFFAQQATTVSSIQSTLAAPNLQLTPPGIQSWSLEQIENHVHRLKQGNQPIPQRVSSLLAEAKRREERRSAKRLANRKSASTSRARKKALVTEMTELNARLRRQALILALIPDLVIVIDVNGFVTFCSAQVERALQHKNDDLVGAPLSHILVPSSRNKLKNLMKELLERGHVTSTVDENDAAVTSSGGFKLQNDLPGNYGPNEAGAENAKRDVNGNSTFTERIQADCERLKPAAIVSEPKASDPSFPLSIVKMNSAPKRNGTEENENSDVSANNEGSGSKQTSSLTNSASIPRSPTASSLGNSGSDGDRAKKDQTSDKQKQVSQKVPRNEKDLPSSDTSNSSSLSTNAKKLQKANANLVRNVRWHNKRMKDKSFRDRAEFIDDVIGDDVIANNASARLSSLRHRMESSSEEDSGYRESNDSREETSSSASDLSDSIGRRKPIAPTCNLCLIRKDLSTVWCEVTSSLRSREPDTKNPESVDFDDDPAPMKAPPTNSARVSFHCTSIGTFSSISSESPVELLLCLRPIRDGESQKKKELRLVSGDTKKSPSPNPNSSYDAHAADEANTTDPSTKSSPNQAMVPLKKRRPELYNNQEHMARSSRDKVSKGDPDNEGSNEVAETMMLMSSVR